MKSHSPLPPPYPYQQRTVEALLEGRPVVLQAPTGAGKTRAAYQWSIQQNYDRGRECDLCWAGHMWERVVREHRMVEHMNLEKISSELLRCARSPPIWMKSTASLIRRTPEEWHMLSYTGHPFVDVGIATITAFVGKTDPNQLTEDDLEVIAEYMQKNYVIDPLKSFLTVAFPNSGFTQPAYKKQPEKRQIYAERVLGAFRSDVPRLRVPGVFTGKLATALPLDVKGALPPGRTFRQHIPLLTGEDIINFFPYGDAGLLISGEALLALHALPLGCAKAGGRLLAVHSDDPDIILRFARRFLQQNRKAIQIAQVEGSKKMPEPPQRAMTFFMHTLIELEQERARHERIARPASITAYHFSNSGQGVDLDIYHLPMEVLDFIRTATASTYRDAWNALVQRGWQITRAGRKRKKTEGKAPPKFNVLYEDMLRLPEDAATFIRTYFLRKPERARGLRKDDPRAEYSIKSDLELISWSLLDLFLRKVVIMDKTRIAHIRTLGDTLADYIRTENDRRFFHTFLTATRYEHVRNALVKASLDQLRRGGPPLITFDQFIAIFEEGEELPRSDWSLARDLVLIRMIERLYQQGWLKSHVDVLEE